MNISNIGSASWASQIQQAKRYEKINLTSPGARIDRVSISNEAMEAYNASIASTKAQDAAFEKIVTDYFNGAYRVVGQPSCVVETDRSSWPPENLELLEQLEAEIDAANTEPHTVFKSKKVREKLEALSQKINALHSLGDKMVVTESVLNKATEILDRLYADWKEEKGWKPLDDTQRGEVRLGSGVNTKDMLSMLLESLFLAELEESGAIGNNRAQTSGRETDGSERGADGNERKTDGDKVSRVQSNKTSFTNPLEDGNKVAQIKKVLNDFAKGKATLGDISTAVGGGKSDGQVKAGDSATKASDDKESKK